MAKTTMHHKDDNEEAKLKAFIARDISSIDASYIAYVSATKGIPITHIKNMFAEAVEEKIDRINHFLDEDRYWER